MLKLHVESNFTSLEHLCDDAAFPDESKNHSMRVSGTFSDAHLPETLKLMNLKLNLLCA